MKIHSSLKLNHEWGKAMKFWILLVVLFAFGCHKEPPPADSADSGDTPEDSAADTGGDTAEPQLPPPDLDVIVDALLAPAENSYVMVEGGVPNVFFTHVKLCGPADYRSLLVSEISFDTMLDADGDGHMHVGFDGNASSAEYMRSCTMSVLIGQAVITPFGPIGPDENGGGVLTLSQGQNETWALHPWELSGCADTIVRCTLLGNVPAEATLKFGVVFKSVTVIYPDDTGVTVDVDVNSTGGNTATGPLYTVTLSGTAP